MGVHVRCITMATRDQEVYTESILDRSVPQLLTAFTAAFSTATSEMQAEAAITFVYNYVINEIHNVMLQSDWVATIVATCTTLVY